jgi:hypothetical protein
VRRLGWLRWLAALVAMLGLAHAQFAVGPDPAAVADEAVEAWLERARDYDLFALASDSPAAFCEELAAFGQDPRLAAATTVNLDDRREVATDADETRLYSYPARLGDATLARVQVLVVQEGDAWRAEAVRLHVEGASMRLPQFIQTPTAGFIFIAISLYLLYLLTRPSWFRQLLAQGWEVIKAHKGIVIVTVVMLYGAYGLGSLFGASLPECQEAIAVLVGGALGDAGVIDVLQQDNVPVTAAVITYWNFLNGTLLTTLTPALFFAVPAYLINLLRFFVLGVALAPVGPQAQLLIFHLPVIVIELLAYILVTAGGGIFLMTLIREGFAGFREGVRRLFLMVPIAFLLLVIGAWYESYEILRLIPMFTGSP